MSKDDIYFAGNPKLKKANVEISYTKEQFEEYIKCVQDPVYFINNYVKIVSIDGGVIPFKLWDFQEELIRSFQAHRFNIVKYGRRSGKTATVSAYILWCILFNKLFEVAVLSNNLKSSKSILASLQFSYEELPIWLQQGVLAWNKTDIMLENGSAVFTNSTSASAIRGRQINLLYMDEFAHVPFNMQEEFYTSAYPTITSGLSSKMIITSTPNGMEYFRKIWMDAKNKKNKFITSEVSWDQVPGRDEAWYEEQIANIGPVLFSQEYSGEFLGSSMTLISGSKLATLVEEEPIYETPDGFKFYQQADREHTYIIVVDTGHGEGLDYSAFIIVDVSATPFEIVGTFRNNTIQPTIYPKFIMEAATYFNNAYILVETNDLGQQVVDILADEMEYEGLLSTANRTRSQEVSSGFTAKMKYGVRTTKLVKRLGCSNAKSIVESNQIKLNDFNLIQELHYFSYKNGSYEATAGYHDDLVMTLVLFAWMSTQPYFKDMTDTNITRRLYQNMDINSYDITPVGIINSQNYDNYDVKYQKDDEGNMWRDYDPYNDKDLYM